MQIKARDCRKTIQFPAVWATRLRTLYIHCGLILKLVSKSGFSASQACFESSIFFLSFFVLINEEPASSIYVNEHLNYINHNVAEIDKARVSLQAMKHHGILLHNWSKLNSHWTCSVAPCIPLTLETGKPPALGRLRWSIAPFSNISISLTLTRKRFCFLSDDLLLQWNVADQAHLIKRWSQSPLPCRFYLLGTMEENLRRKLSRLHVWTN